MAERNAPIADWFSSVWPDSWPSLDYSPGSTGGASTGGYMGSRSPAGDAVTWDGRDSMAGSGIGGSTGASADKNYGTSYGDDHRSPGSHPRNKGGSGGSGGNGGSGGGGKPQGMSLREYIEYQEQAAQSAAKAQARETRLGVYDWVRSSFQQWGMPDGFANDVIGIVKDARSPEQAMTMIRDTDAYRTRFAGNIARAEAGFGMLSEAEYLGLESSYRQSMRAAGLLEGFYDDPNDFADFISKDVSPEEIAARAEIAGTLAQQTDPQLWKELESRGISKGDAAAYMLDPDRALPAIQRKLAGADIGRAAREAGIKVKNKFENKLVDKGISTEAAKAAFVSVKAEEKDLDALAARYGEKEFGKKGLIKGELGLDKGKTVARRKALASRERAEWSGQAGSAAMAFGSSEE